MASIIRPGLFLVIERFPDHRELFKRLYADKEGFRSLCENYRQCLDALRYWAHTEQKNAPNRHREYRKLLCELERELLQYRQDYHFTEFRV